MRNKQWKVRNDEKEKEKGIKEGWREEKERKKEGGEWEGIC